jgi:hypothetical protein
MGNYCHYFCKKNQYSIVKEQAGSEMALPFFIPSRIKPSETKIPVTSQKTPS